MAGRLGDAGGISTLAHWTQAHDFGAFVVGQEPPKIICGFLAAFSEQTGLGAVAGRVDDLSYDNPIHLQLDWIRLGSCRVLAPANATLNGVRLASLPQFRTAPVRVPQRVFCWKYAHDRPVLGADILLGHPS